MAKTFNLTAQINLAAPNNIRPVIQNIRQQLQSANLSVNVQVNPNTVSQVNSLNSALSAVHGTTKATTASFSAQAQAIKQVTTATTAAKTEMEAFGYQAALAVRRFAAFGVGTAGILGFVSAIKTGVEKAIQFDKEMTRLKQVSGESALVLKSLANEVTRLSTSFGVSSTELLDVTSTLAQAGLTVRETKTALEALAKSSLAPSFDNLKDTTEGVIAAMRQFNLEAGDVDDALSSINSVAAAFAVESKDIITAIRQTGGVFATASKGITDNKDALNQFISIFTSVRQTTRESAESIATGLRTIFTRIQRPQTIAYLKEFGIELDDLQHKFVGPAEAVKRLQEGLSKLDPRDVRFAQVEEELGGFRQIGKVIPLLQQGAVVSKAYAIAQNSVGSLSRDAATAQEALAIQIAKVREEFLALVRAVTQSDAFNAFAHTVISLAQGFITLGNALRPLLPYLAALGAIKLASSVTQFAGGFFGGLKQTTRAYAGGGLVGGTGNSDNQLIMTTPGEFVIRKDAVKALGVDTLHSLNKYVGGGNTRKEKINAKLGLALNAEKPNAGNQFRFQRPDNGDYYMDGPYGGLFFQLGNQSVSTSTIPLSVNELSAENKAQLPKGAKRILGQPYQFYVNPQQGEQFHKSATKAFDSSLHSILDLAGGAKQISSEMGISEEKLLTDIKQQVGFEGIAGGLFEAYISGISRQVNPKRERYFDFHPIGAAFEKLFGSGIKGISYADAKLTATPKAKSSIVKKAASAYLSGQAPDLSLNKAGTKIDPYRARSEDIISRAGADIIQRASGGKVPILATPGEYILNKSAADSIGDAGLHALNNIDRFAYGGLVSSNTRVGQVTRNQAQAAIRKAKRNPGDAAVQDDIPEDRDAIYALIKQIKSNTPGIGSQDALNQARSAYLGGQRANGLVLDNTIAQNTRGNPVGIGVVPPAPTSPSPVQPSIGNTVNTSSSSPVLASVPTPVAPSPPASRLAGIGQRLGQYGPTAAFLAAPAITSAIGTSTPTNAAIGGGLGGGVAGAATGGAVGGPLGAALGGAIGAVEGFVGALRDAKLKEAFAGLEKAVTSADAVFKSFGKGGASEAEVNTSLRQIHTRASDQHTRTQGFGVEDAYDDNSLFNLSGNFEYYTSSEEQRQKKFQKFKEARHSEQAKNREPALNIATSLAEKRFSQGNFSTDNVDAVQLRSFAYAAGPRQQANLEKLNKFREGTPEREAEEKKIGKQEYEAFGKLNKSIFDASQAAARAAGQVEILAQKFEKVSALTERAAADTDKFNIAREGAVAQAQGQVGVGRLASTSDIFKNNTAYSQKETADAIEGLGLNKNAKGKLSDSILSGKALAEDLPKYLLELQAPGKNPDNQLNTALPGAIDEILKRHGLEGKLPDEARHKIEADVQEQTANKQQSSKDVQIYIKENLSKTIKSISDEALKAAENLAKGLDEANKVYIEGVNQFSQLRLGADKQLAEFSGANTEDNYATRRAFGFNTAGTEAIGQNARLRSLAGTSIADTIDKNQIGLETRATDIRGQLANGNLGDEKTKALIDELAANTEQQAKNKEALGIVATSSKELAAIESQLAQETAKRNSGSSATSFALNATGADRARFRRGQQYAAQIDAGNVGGLSRRQLQLGAQYHEFQQGQIVDPEQKAAAEAKFQSGLGKSAVVQGFGFDARTRSNIAAAGTAPITAQGGGTKAEQDLYNQAGAEDFNKQEARRALDRSARAPLQNIQDINADQRAKRIYDVRAAGNSLAPTPVGTPNGQPFAGLDKSTFDDFAKNTQPLVDAMNAFPKTLTIEGTHQVNVNVAGSLEGPLKDFIIGEVAKAIGPHKQPLDARLEQGTGVEVA